MKNAWPLQTVRAFFRSRRGRETAAVSNLVLSGVRRIPVVKPAFATLYLTAAQWPGTSSASNVQPGKAVESIPLHPASRNVDATRSWSPPTCVVKTN